jgi:hypothetical protein
MSPDPTAPEDFEAAFEAARPRLQAAILAACPPQGEWPERLIAAIYAALEFAAADPLAAAVLTRDALTQRPDGPEHFLELIGRFAEQLRALVPRHPRLPDSTERAVIGAIAMVITDHLRQGRPDRLPERGPELVELSLQPYLGRAAARRFSRRGVRS